VEEHAAIGLADPEKLTYFFITPALNIPQGNHLLLRRREIRNRLFDMGPAFLGQQELLWRHIPLLWLRNPTARALGIVRSEETAGIHGGIASFGVGAAQGG
jgi:hypothetical protein